MKVAVITPVFNEEDMLPHFLSHYKDSVDTVFILDNESTDRTESICRSFDNVVFSKFETNGKFNDVVQHKALMDVKGSCRGRYNYVIIPDADEFVVAKSGRSIRAELEALPPDEVHGTHGFWMAQHLSEPAYAPSIPLMVQRKWGAEDLEGGSKPYIVRPESVRTFTIGRHRLVDPPDKPELVDPRLSKFLLLHYIAVDEGMYIRRRLHGRIKRISDENRAGGHGSHYFSGDENTLHHEYNGRRHFKGLCRVID